MRPDCLQILKDIGTQEDADIDLIEGALALGAVDSPDLSLDRYRNHMRKMIDAVRERHAQILEEGEEDSAGSRLAALKFVVHDTHGYLGDLDSYDDLQNANLIRVIERQKGMPISLGILYVHIAQTLGWDVVALNFPAHVVCAINFQGQKLLFDPFYQCKVLQAFDLRKILKDLVGKEAELHASYYEPSTRRDMLIRLQNNIKLRQIEHEEYTDACKTVEMMRLIDPQEYRLLFDAGVLYVRTKQTMAAIDVLEEYVERTPSRQDREEALFLLGQIKEGMN